MRSIARRIFVPTVVLAAVAMVSLAYAAWTSAQQVSAVERDTQVVRAATALATALEDATEQEERATLAIPLAPAAWFCVMLFPGSAAGVAPGCPCCGAYFEAHFACSCFA